MAQGCDVVEILTLHVFMRYLCTNWTFAEVQCKGETMCRWMARALPLFLSIVITISQTALGAEKEEPIHVAILMAGCMTEHDRIWLKYFEEHPLVSSGKIMTRTFVGDGNPDSIVNLMEVIELGDYDAVIATSDSRHFGHMIAERMADAGIPLWGTSLMATDKLNGYVGPDDLEAGYLTAKAIFSTFADGGRVVVLKGSPDSMVTEAREAGLRKALAEHPEIEILEEANANWSETEAFSQMDRWLTYYLDRKIDGVIAQNDDMAIGALNAIRSASVPLLPVVGVDGIPEAVEAVENSELFLTLRRDAQVEAFAILKMILEHFGSSHRGDTSDMTKLVVPWKIITASDMYTQK